MAGSWSMKGLNIDIWSTNSQKTIHIINNIISVDFDALDRGSLDGTTDWGIYANTGKIEFVDNDNEFANFIKNNVIDKITVIIYISSYTARRKLATFDLEDFELSKMTKKVSLNLKDRLLTWQDIEDSEIYFFDDTTLYSLANQLAERNGVQISFTDKARDRMSRITIYCPLFEANNLWANMEKICVAGHCRLSTNVNGIAEFSCDDDINLPKISINPYHILNIPNRIDPNKTKIQSASLTAKNITKNTNRKIDNSIPFKIYEVDSDEKVMVITWHNVADDKTKNAQFNKAYLTNYGAYDLASFWGVFKLSAKTHEITRFVCTGTKYYQNVTSSQQDTGKNINDPINLANNNSYFTRYDNSVTLNFAIMSRTQAEGTDWTSLQLFSDGVIDFYGNYFVEGEEEKFSYKQNDYPSLTLPTNDLIQTYNTFEKIEGNVSINIPHNEMLLDDVQKRFSKGIECYEVECAISDYYYNDNYTLALNGAGEGVDTFKKYDVVVPYRIISGKSEPLSSNANGTPKSFIIIGIKYHYQGHLKQTLYLQEIPTLEL